MIKIDLADVAYATMPAGDTPGWLRCDRNGTRVLIAGDFCPWGRVEPIMSSPDARRFWSCVQPIVSAHEVSIVNLECPLTDRDCRIFKTGPHLHATPQCAHGLRAGGFNVASLANNHILDMGVEGLADTIQACHSVGIQTIGASVAADTLCNVTNIETTESIVHVLAFADAEFSAASNGTGGACSLDLIEAYHHVRTASSKGGVVVVLVHAGNEGFHLPSPRLVKTCRFLVEAGANAVVCHHSHVATGYEWYHGSPIFYGIGNLVFDWPSDPGEEWYTGYLVSLEIGRDVVRQAYILPYQQCKGNPSFDLLNGEQRERALEKINGRSSIIAAPASLLQHWRSFCRSNRRYYWKNLLSGNALSDLFWRFGIPQVRWSPKRLARLYNLLRCPAHHDVLLEILNDEIERLTSPTRE